MPDLARPFLPVLGVFLLGASCAKREAPSASAEPSPRTATLSSAAVAPGVVSFRRDIVPYLGRSCAGSSHCHGSEPTESIALDLRAPAAYRELVGRPSKARPTALRVAPGDPSRSFIVDKLRGELVANEGKRMPLDVDTGAPQPLTEEGRTFVDEVLTAWILEGAPDN